MWFFRRNVDPNHLDENWKEYKRRCGIDDDVSTFLDPYEIMTYAVSFAGKDSQSFDPRCFKYAMQSMFFGDGFDQVVSELDRDSKYNVAKSKKDFDKALDKLTHEVGKSIQSNNLHKIQENGVIRKCILNIMYVCKGVALSLFVSSSFVAAESVKHPEKFQSNMKNISGSVEKHQKFM